MTDTPTGDYFNLLPDAIIAQRMIERHAIAETYALAGRCRANSPRKTGRSDLSRGILRYNQSTALTKPNTSADRAFDLFGDMKSMTNYSHLSSSLFPVIFRFSLHRPIVTFKNAGQGMRLPSRLRFLIDVSV